MNGLRSERPLLVAVPLYPSFSWVSGRERDLCHQVEQSLVDDKWILVFLVSWSHQPTKSRILIGHNQLWYGLTEQLSQDNKIYCYIARLSLNKTSTVVGWFLVTYPWSNSNVSRPRYNCAVVARKSSFAIWSFKEKSKYITKHLMYGPSGN